MLLGKISRMASSLVALILDDTGYWESKGSIRVYWGQLGYQDSKLGLPTGPEVSGPNNSWWQEYENGYIIGSGATNFWESMGDIRERWSELGFQDGKLGFPIGPELILDIGKVKAQFVSTGVNLVTRIVS